MMDMELKTLNMDADIGKLLRSYRDYRRKKYDITLGKDFLSGTGHMNVEQLMLRWDTYWKSLTDADYNYKTPMASQIIMQLNNLYNKGEGYRARIASFACNKIKSENRKALNNLKKEASKLICTWTAANLYRQVGYAPSNTLYNGIYSAIREYENTNSDYIIDVDAFLTLLEWDNDGVDYAYKSIRALLEMNRNS